MTGDRSGGDGSGGDPPPPSRPYGYIPVIVGVVVLGAAVASWLMVSDSWVERGTFLSLVLVSFAGGGVIGLIVGGPGAGPGDAGTDDANSEGWSARLGVFGNWITGAAFALVIANASEIVEWFSSLTEAASSTGENADLAQYALGAWMIAAAIGGFIIGFIQMVTNGRLAIESAAAEAERVADKLNEVAVLTKDVSATFTEAYDRAVEASVIAAEAATAAQSAVDRSNEAVARAQGAAGLPG